MMKQSSLTLLAACGLAMPAVAAVTNDPTCETAGVCQHVDQAELAALRVAQIEAQQRALKMIEAQTFFALPESHQKTIASKLEAMGEDVPSLSAETSAELAERSKPLTEEELEAAWGKVKDVVTREAFEGFSPIHQRMLASFAEVAPTHGVPVAPCFGPGTDAAVIQAFEAIMFNVNPMAFQQTDRWQGTALNPGGASQGDPTILTYSFPADGVTVPNGVGEGNGPNNLNSWLDGIYGNRATWRALYDQIFARWGELSGNTYILEPNDDNVTLFNSPGLAGVRGDLRMAAKTIDGNSGILAYNFFPQNGDMVLDSADNFYNQLGGNSLRLRNILLHEHGHGMGQLHVCPLGDILMNPFINTSFDGPQLDDVLNAQRHYGDPLEPNDSIGQATDLGSVGVGGSLNVGGTGPSNPGRVDFMSVDDNSDRDFYRINLTGNGAIEATVSPVGFTYLEGPQTQQCNTGSSYSPQQFGDLRIFIYNSAGQIIASADDTNAGSAETVGVNAMAGVYYVEIRNSGENTIQAYSLDVDITPPQQFPLSLELDGAVPEIIAPATTASFGVQIMLNDDAIVDGPTLNIRPASGGAFTEIGLVDNGGGSFTANIPAQLCGDDPEFFVSVDSALGGTQTLPASGTFNAVIGTGEFDVDSGEGSIAFTVAGNIATQEAGRWTNGTPQNNGRDDPATDADGTNQAWLTGQSASTDNSDVDGGSTILVSPIYDFSSGGTVSFSYWMQDTVNPIGPEDGFTFEVSANGGSTWQVARDFTTAGTWRSETVDIGAEFGTSANFRFRFVATDNDPGDVLECGVDAITVTSLSCEDPATCPGDVADDFGSAGADGQVTFGDFLFALTVLGPCPGGTPGCTFDIADDFGSAGGDGQVSFGDFLFALTVLGPCP